MKRLLTSWLLAVTLMVGVTGVSTHQHEIIVSHAFVTDQHNSLPVKNQCFFDANTLFPGIGFGTEQVRLTHLFPHFSVRTFQSLSNALRISHSSQLECQKIIAGYQQFLLKSAFKQLDGYYLYYLRKLLI